MGDIKPKPTLSVTEFLALSEANQVTLKSTILGDKETAI